ncbi:MAG: tRNA (adenosine(37)-N6)-threonylcarbamoyltransferase complex transferase subunit TsaD [Candidatus Aegiribacteria sp.]|nr:tRNA (adenosine(37)-N6)-threonylcarbamoyltransferase complex transferase subunit TsaD [Candidatus Aegiribacteria sp.]MBD3294047.1 tRNA (adenosine(37)-N6)-threonylcarbamoyltransferase complex transferase subunit TsaD [Candidatus Fermentibacteria bacterium]
MRVLAVETSCDDTAVALVEDGRSRCEKVHSQSIHTLHGGVVPELASRGHAELLPRLVEMVLQECGISSIDQIDAMAATAGPGLIGSLLVGLSWTKAAAWASGIRFLAINHLSAHLHIHYGTEKDVDFPAVALLVSGGHTCIFRMDSWECALLLGATRDDAAGEAFDKTAKVTGLGFPGGAELDRVAEMGDADKVSLPSPMADPSLPEFSFSGLKTAAKLAWEKGARLEDLAASFRSTVVDLLVSKLMFQCERTGAKTVLAAGGVSANSLLRTELKLACEERGCRLLLPSVKHATDNALMVARAAEAVLRRRGDASSPISCDAFARWTGDRLYPLCCQ